MTVTSSVSWPDVPAGTVVYVPSEDYTGRIYEYKLVAGSTANVVIVAYGKHPKQRRHLPAAKCYTDRRVAHEYEAHFLRGAAKRLEYMAEKHADAAGSK